MKLGRSGGGLLTNGRTQSKGTGLPAVSPMRPQPQQAAPQAPPQQQAAPAPVQAPQSMPMDQGMQQGGMPPDPNMEQPGGRNDMMNNALALLHDPRAAPEFENMISQGEEGAATAAVTIGKQVVQAHVKRGFEPDVNQASDAIMEVVGDIVEIGIANGSIPSEPMINGVPAGMYATLAYAADQWAAVFPEFGDSLKQEITQATQQDDEAARQVAAYMQQRKQGANQSQPTGQQPGISAADNSAGGSIPGAPV